MQLQVSLKAEIVGHRQRAGNKELALWVTTLRHRWRKLAVDACHPGKHSHQL